MSKFHGETVEYWKQNAEENYLTTPISVLKYITVLEEHNQALHIHNVVGQSEQLKIEKYNDPLTGKNGTYVSDKVGDYIDNF